VNVAARLLANENVPGAVVAARRHSGHDVRWIREDASGSPDAHVLERAQHEGREVVTFDKDFGELAFRRGLAALVGVVLFPITLTSP
jgi:predicted nucleic acid-binding protein